MRRRRRDRDSATPGRRGVGITPLVGTAAVVGTVVALAIAMLGSGPTGLTGARDQLLEDLAFARTVSMQAQPVPHEIVFDPASQCYHVALASDPDTPVRRADGTPCSVSFRDAQWRGVAMRVTAMGGDERVGFGAFGQLDQRADAVVLLSNEQDDLEIHISAQSGTATWTASVAGTD